MADILGRKILNASTELIAAIITLKNKNSGLYLPGELNDFVEKNGPFSSWTLEVVADEPVESLGQFSGTEGAPDLDAIVLEIFRKKRESIADIYYFNGRSVTARLRYAAIQPGPERGCQPN